jgi:hypothetical protein
MVNIIVIFIFLMISTSLNNSIINASLSSRDYEQSMAIIFLMISICIIVILFFQWVIRMLFHSLYDGRSTFHINIRLAGISKRMLYRIYLAEMFRMQVIAIPAGLVFGEVLYLMIARQLGFPDGHLTLASLIGAAAIHFFVVLFSVTRTFQKANILSPIEWLRADTWVDSKSRLSIGKTTVGVVILLFVFFVSRAKMDPLFIQSIQLLLIVAYFFLQEFLFYVFNYVEILAGKLSGSGIFRLSQALSESSYKRTKTLAKMIVFSVMLTIGLQSLYLSTRQAAGRVSKETVHYESLALFDEPFQLTEEQLKSDDLYMLKFLAGSTTAGNIWAQGINSEFLKQPYETIHLNDTLSGFGIEELLSRIDDKDWNGVIFPENLITREDIGRTFTASINGVSINFEIVAGCYLNHFNEVSCLVSNAFLEAVLGLKGYANIAFSLTGFETSAFSSHAVIQSKEELERASYDEVVKSTELIELAANLTFVCALIMLLNYVFFISSEKKADYIKLCAMGLTGGTANGIFIVHFLQTVIFALIIGIPLAGVLSTVACAILMSPYYYPEGITYPIPVVVTETVLLLTLPVLIFIGCIRATHTQIVGFLRNMAND